MISLFRFGAWYVLRTWSSLEVCSSEEVEIIAAAIAPQVPGRNHVSGYLGDRSLLVVVAL